MARKNNKGWVLIYRQLLESDIWNTEEPFDFRSAWIDLILMANHEDRSLILKSGDRVVIQRGQLWTSTRSLAKRWRWSNQKVLRYTKTLEKMGMVTAKKSKSGTLITLEKYSDFQDMRNTSGNASRNASGNATGNASGNGTKNLKNYNNVERKEADASGLPALED